MIEEHEFLRLISDSIRKRRLSKKYSSEKLSELADMDYSSINLIENQKQNPRSYTLYKLLFALDIDITSPLREISNQQMEYKKIITQKLDLMTNPQLEALAHFLNTFEITHK